MIATVAHQRYGQKCLSDSGQLAAYHRKMVKDWVAERTDPIGLFCVRSNIPQPNPEERLDADFKPEMGKRVSA